MPVENSADEWRNEISPSLGRGDRLHDREYEGEVAMNVVLVVKFEGGLDAFPCGGKLDQNARLVNACLLVEL